MTIIKCTLDTKHILSINKKSIICKKCKYSEGVNLNMFLDRDFKTPKPLYFTYVVRFL